jgi:hypothetical protein
MRTFIKVCVAAAILFTAVGTYNAQTDNNFGITPERRLARTLASVADTCFQCGEKAKEKGLYQLARSYYNHALLYDAEHRNTRRVMGFRKRRGEWVLEEDLVPLSDIVVEARREQLEQDLANETLSIRQSKAEELFAHVENTRLSEEQRLLALYHALRISPEYGPALRAARGLRSEHMFVHDLDREGEVHRDVWIQRANDGERIEEHTDYERKCGFRFQKRRSDWFILHVDIGEQSAAWAQSLTRFAEASRTRALDLMSLPAGTPPENDEHKLHYTVLHQRERFARFVEECSGITDVSHRREVAQASGGTPVYNPYGSVWYYPRLENDHGLRDAIAHDIASKEVFRYAGLNAYWLGRGMGYLNSAQMSGSTRAVFYGIRSTGVIDSGGVEALPGLGNSPAGWRLQVGMELVADSVMRPTEIARLRIQDYHQREMAHAFCYTDFLVSEHSEKLAAFLRDAYEERTRRMREEESEENPIELLNRLFEHLEMDEQQFINEFRVWAFENYFNLPSDD